MTLLMSEISAKSDASSHQNQTQDSLQRDPGEIEQRPHTVAIQLHKGILEREIMRKGISELQLLFLGGMRGMGKRRQLLHPQRSPNNPAGTRRSHKPIETGIWELCFCA